MRIVDVCAFYSPLGGGVKTYVRHKMRAGPRLGHEIIVLVPSIQPGVEIVGPGARIEYVEGKPFPLDKRYNYFYDEAALHAKLNALKPDFVEASTPWSSAGIVARWRTDVPRSLIMHADPLGNYAYRWFRGVASRPMIDRGFEWFWQRLRRLDERFDHIICASSDLTARLKEGGLKKVVMNRMGVEPDIFSPANRDLNARRYLLKLCDLPEHALLLVGAGRHAPEKRWPMIIQAVTASGYKHPIGLIIAGDGRCSAAVHKAVAGNPHIRLISPILDRNEFATFLASGDALVHGSESETFCMIAAEARASGLPMLVPDSGAVAEHLVTNAGYHYHSAKAASLAQAIRRLAGEGTASHQATARVAAHDTRTMDEHFKDLFDLYTCSVRSKAGAGTAWRDLSLHRAKPGLSMAPTRASDVVRTSSHTSKVD
ncbi:glycosyltransferase [Sphingobium yanoikuyae]|jgi:alpha-1,6-mannosyltransferase|uniref:glycosyltransferase n=1 Tax=Sphingobium yanoikuyae TaxID=13690 RepID=UPI0028DCD402|nr:glycosyltransferase [Sphingobium yanoikuyae]